MEEFYPLFFENLSDSIPSVRQGAAISLGNVVKAYGKMNLVLHYPFNNYCQKSIQEQQIWLLSESS